MVENINDRGNKITVKAFVQLQQYHSDNSLLTTTSYHIQGEEHSRGYGVMNYLTAVANVRNCLMKSLH